MKGKNIRIVMKKDLKGLLNERTILLAIVLQIFVAMFSSFLVVGLTSMYDPSSLSRYSGVRYPVAYSGSDSALQDYLSENREFQVYQMDLSPAVAALSERKLSAVIYVPDTPPDAGEPVKITLYTIQNDISSTIVNVRLKELFLRYENNLRSIREPRLDIIPIALEFPEQTGGSDFYEFIYALLIPLLLFMPAIISSALVIDIVTEEYQHSTLETILSTPVTLGEVIWGKVLACEVLVPLQAGAWIVLLSLNGVMIQNIPAILVQVMMFSMILILLGALTALYYRERTAAQFIYSTVVVVLMLLALAVPDNPLNLVARLATGTAGSEQWLIFALVGLVVLFLALLTQRAAEWAARKTLAG